MKKILLFILLLIAVVAIAAYIRHRNLGPGKDVEVANKPKPNATETNTTSTATNTPPAAVTVDLSNAVTYDLGTDALISFTIYAGVHEKLVDCGDVVGALRAAEGKLEGAQLNVTNMMELIVSEDTRFDKVLMSDKLFDVEQYPESTFNSTAITKDGDNYKIAGNLNIVGKSVPIEFSTPATVSAKTISFKKEFVVDRKDWGLNYSGLGNFAIKDEVLISVELTATRK